MYLSGDPSFRPRRSVKLRQPVRRLVLPARYMQDHPLGVLPAVVPFVVKAVKVIAAVVPLIKHGTLQPAFSAVISSNAPGRSLDITALNKATYYLYSMENHGLFKLNKAFGKKKGFETFLVTLTEKIGDAAKAGLLSSADDAESVYQKVIMPWLAPILGNIEDSWKKLFVAYVDRYLYGQTFGAIDSRIKKLSDVVTQAIASNVPATQTTVPSGIAPTVPVIDIPAAPTQASSQMLTLPPVAETAAPSMQAAMAAGPPGWLIPTLIGAGVLLLTRKGRRK